MGYATEEQPPMQIAVEERMDDAEGIT